MPKRLHNPDPSALPLRFLMEQANEAHLLVPARGSVVVSDRVAAAVQTLYATLEVSEATEEEYLAFRESKAKEEEAKKQAELDAREAAEKAEKDRLKEEKQHAKLLEKQKVAEKKATDEALAKALEEEKASQDRVAATTVRVLSGDNLPAAPQPEVKVTEPVLGASGKKSVGRPRKSNSETT